MLVEALSSLGFGNSSATSAAALHPAAIATAATICCHGTNPESLKLGRKSPRQEDGARGEEDQQHVAGPVTSRFQETVAGLIAGGVGKIVEHPLDTVKVRLQEEPGHYRNAVDCCRRMLNEEGRSSFYRGVWPPLVVSAYEHAFTFVVYNAALGWVEERRLGALGLGNTNGNNGGRTDFTSLEARSKMPLTTHVLAGAGSGLISAHVLTPAEFIKCRQQQRTSSPELGGGGSASIGVKQLLGNGGWRHLFDGHVATVAREVPGTAAWFCFYEAGLRFFTGSLFTGQNNSAAADVKSSDDLPNSTVALCGGFAGVAYWTVFYPADVVKTRMQLSPKVCSLGFRRCLVQVYRQEGVRALYSGWSCMALSAFPSNAAIFLVYEKLRVLFAAQTT